MRLLNYIRLFGFLFIISAICIITLVIPYYDKKVEDISSDIEIFNSGRVFAGIVSLNANHLLTRKRIDMFEANIREDRNGVQFLRQNALNRTVTVIRTWASFYVGEDKSITQNIENEIDKIVNDNNITLATKLKRAQELLIATENDAFERLRKAHDERDEKNVKLKEVKKSHSRWNTLFVWLQVLGLVLFTGSETIERILPLERRRAKAITTETELENLINKITALENEVQKIRDLQVSKALLREKIEKNVQELEEKLTEKGMISVVEDELNSLKDGIKNFEKRLASLNVNSINRQANELKKEADSIKERLEKTKTLK